MEVKTFEPGDKVSLRTLTKTWEGHILESHDPQVLLLKLNSGYNIGIREDEVLDAKILEKAEERVKEPFTLPKKPKLQNIALVITGGTISSRLDPKSGAVIPTDEEEILKIAPEISNICNITRIEKPFLKFSEDMSWLDWKKLAEISSELLNDKKIDGIVITHGSDTLHYTSAALSFFLQNLNKPVALTYSQRSIDRASTDASLNLICAAKYAISDIAEVAIIAHKDSNDESCIAIPGKSARKMHTSKRATFEVINDTPIAEISKDNFKILKTFNARNNSGQVKLDSKYSPHISIVKVHPGLDPEIIEHYQKIGYKGLILEVTGLGHVPGRDSEGNLLPKIKKAIQEGMTICATAQTIFGSLNPNVYSRGRELLDTGIIFLENMTSECAFVKLGWILGHKGWNPKEKFFAY